MAGQTVRLGMVHEGPNTQRYSTRDDDIGRQLVTIFLVVGDQADKSQQLCLNVTRVEGISLVFPCTLLGSLKVDFFLGAVSGLLVLRVRVDAFVLGL